MAGGSVGGTYRDLTGGTTGFPIVIGAVLYVAYNTLDMGATFLIVHFLPSFRKTSHGEVFHDIRDHT